MPDIYKEIKKEELTNITKRICKVRGLNMSLLTSCTNSKLED
jgi:hypothetical protein